MEHGSFILTTFIVVAVVAILGWAGDWSGSRQRTANSRYWLSHEIHCPDCECLFTPTHVEVGECIITPKQHFNVSLTCPSCGESFEYARADGPPTFLYRSPTTRRCIDCDSIYNGIVGQKCPDCGSTQSRRDVHPMLAQEHGEQSVATEAAS